MQLGLAPNPQREGRAYALVVQIMAVEKGNFRAQAHILCRDNFCAPYMRGEFVRRQHLPHITRLRPAWNDATDATVEAFGPRCIPLLALNEELSNGLLGGAS